MGTISLPPPPLSPPLSLPLSPSLCLAFFPLSGIFVFTTKDLPNKFRVGRCDLLFSAEVGYCIWGHLPVPSPCLSGKFRLRALCSLQTDCFLFFCHSNRGAVAVVGEKRDSREKKKVIGMWSLYYLQSSPGFHKQLVSKLQPSQAWREYNFSQSPSSLGAQKAIVGQQNGHNRLTGPLDKDLHR